MTNHAQNEVVLRTRLAAAAPTDERSTIAARPWRRNTKKPSRCCERRVAQRVLRRERIRTLTWRILRGRSWQRPSSMISARRTTLERVGGGCDDSCSAARIVRGSARRCHGILRWILKS